MRPLLLVAGAMAALVLVEPDLGTAIVISLTLGALLIAGGVELRHLVMLAGAALIALVSRCSSPTGARA